jgi:hypothetical protein
VTIDWTDGRLVDVDERYDREQASNGHSWFGEYLRLNAKLFRDAWQDEPAPVKDPAEFAVHAWHVATPPVMAPGYVRWRPDLSRVTLHRDEYDHSLYAEVHVPLRHSHLFTGQKRLPYSWRDWQTESDYGNGGYESLRDPGETGRPTVLASVVVRVPGRDWSLVTPTAYEGRTLTDEAQEAVSVVAKLINEDAGPIVARVLE